MSKYFKYKYLVNNAYNFFFGCYTFKTPKEFSTTGFQKGVRSDQFAPRMKPVKALIFALHFR